MVSVPKLLRSLEKKQRGPSLTTGACGMTLKEAWVPVLFSFLSARPLNPSKLQALLTQARPRSAVMVNGFHMLGCSCIRKPERNGSDAGIEVAVSRGEGWWWWGECPQIGGKGFFLGCCCEGEVLGGSQRQHVLACWEDGCWHQEKSIQRSQPSLIIWAAELPAPFKIFQEGFSPKIELKMCWALLRISSVWALWEVSGRL